VGITKLRGVGKEQAAGQWMLFGKVI